MGRDTCICYGVKLRPVVTPCAAPRHAACPPACPTGQPPSERQAVVQRPLPPLPQLPRLHHHGRRRGLRADGRHRRVPPGRLPTGRSAPAASLPHACMQEAGTHAPGMTASALQGCLGQGARHRMEPEPARAGARHRTAAHVATWAASGLCGRGHAMPASCPVLPAQTAHIHTPQRASRRSLPTRSRVPAAPRACLSHCPPQSRLLRGGRQGYQLLTVDHEVGGPTRVYGCQ